MTDLNDLMEEYEYRRHMEESARDWEIIRNRSWGTHERIWSKDSDYDADENAQRDNGESPDNSGGS